MALDLEDYKKIAERNKAFMDSVHQAVSEVRRKELEEQGIITNNTDNNRDNKDDFFGDCDSPNSLENGPAIILYIIIMVGGAIFYDRWLIWIFATVIFFKFINRHKKQEVL